MTFRHHSSRVKVSHVGRQLWRLDYTGVMGDAAFAALRANALSATRGAELFFIHMERSLVATSQMPPPCRKIYAGSVAPAAIVVRPDQWRLWKDYADAMARIGIMRLIFLESDQAQAQRWLDCWQGAQSLTTIPSSAETTEFLVRH